MAMFSKTTSSRLCQLAIAIQCLIAGGGVALSVANHFLGFQERSLLIGALMAFSLMVLFSVVTYLAVFRVSAARLAFYSKAGKILLVMAALLGGAFLVTFFSITRPLPPQWHALEIYANGDKSLQSSGSEVRLINIFDQDGYFVSFDSLKRSGEWRIDDGRLVSSGNQPSSLTYRFRHEPGMVFNIEFDSHPNGGMVVVRLDDDEQIMNLFESGDGIALYRTNVVYSRDFWKSLFHAVDIIAFALAVFIAVIWLIPLWFFASLRKWWAISISDKRYLILLGLLCVVVVIWAAAVMPHGKSACYGAHPYYNNCDAGLWFEIAQNPSVHTFDESILKHRPLFGMTAHFFYVPLQAVMPIVETYYPLNWSWWIQNILLFLASSLICFMAVKKLTGSVNKAFFFAVLVSISSHMFAWLLQPNNNIGGFFIIFASLYMVLDYLETEDAVDRRRKLVIYSLLYGLLMLGKAHYNIWISLVAAAVVLAPRRYLRDAIIFTLLQLVPLVLWVVLLQANGIAYRNYEISQGGSVVWLFEQGPFTLELFGSYIRKALLSGVYNIRDGLGVAYVFIALLFIGARLKGFLGKYLFVYYLSTSVFLWVTGFGLVRHALDFSPIAYLGAAYLVDWAREKIPTGVFWLLAGLGIVLLMLYNFNETLIQGMGIY